jgi:hypothetical protein
VPLHVTVSAPHRTTRTTGGYHNALHLSCARARRRSLVVTLIIVVSLALVAAGYGRDQITPVLALFGSIVGYLLGTASRKDGKSD